VSLRRPWGGGEASLTGGRRVGRSVVKVASVSDEPSNTASEWMRGIYAVLNDFESPPLEMIRSSFTGDFIYEDRRRGALFPIMGAELVGEAFASFWATGAGRPRFTVHRIVAVRGERLVAARLVVDYDIGFVLEAIQMLQLDATVTRVQRAFDFDVDDVEAVIAELDRLHSRADTN
jgi:hypothetical protein